MAFIKVISTKNTPANLTLKSNKAATSPASSISADKIADLDLITGSNFSAPGVSQKIINGAGLQDIGRADQIIGSIDRGSASVMDQVGLQAPSVKMPGSVGGGMLDALDPESYIASFDRTGGLESAGRGARMNGGGGNNAPAGNASSAQAGNANAVPTGGNASSAPTGGNEGQIPQPSGEPGSTVTQNPDGTRTVCLTGTTTQQSSNGNTTSTLTITNANCRNSSTGATSSSRSTKHTSTTNNGDGTQTTQRTTMTTTNGELTSSELTTETSDAPSAACSDTGGVAASIAGSAISLAPACAASGPAMAACMVVGGTAGYLLWKAACQLPNPEDDNAYGGTLKDPFGIVSDAQTKRLFPIAKILDPAIDPNTESNTNGIYTGPSLGAVTGSNGGTSTGSWNNPYGVGGYSGPSVDAIAFSNGGSSTGTFDPLF